MDKEPFLRPGYSRPDAIRLVELEPSHIEKIGEIMDALDVQGELMPHHTLSYLTDLWITERSKGDGANREAMEKIEGIVYEARAIQTNKTPQPKNEVKQPHPRHFHNAGHMIEGIMKTIRYARTATEKEVMDALGVDISKLGKKERQCAVKAFWLEKHGKFKKAAKMYLSTAKNTDDFDRSTEWYAKAGENYNLAGRFKEAAIMYWRAAIWSKNDPERRSDRHAKSGENYQLAENFEAAGRSYLYAAEITTNPIWESKWHAKADENFARAEEKYYLKRKPEKAAKMYLNAALGTSDSTLKEKWFAKAGKINGIPYLWYYNRLGRSFFIQKVISENQFNLASLDTAVNRLRFDKTGSELIPLGGKLTGYIIRVVPESSFESWKKADEALRAAGLPDRVEPILRVYRRLTPKGGAKIPLLSGGRWMVSTVGGLVSVVTRYCGEQYKIVAENDRMKYSAIFKLPSDELNAELRKQRAAILHVLNKAGVEHGHPHDGNFTVDIKDGKPFVRIIDFDKASSRTE